MKIVWRILGLGGLAAVAVVSILYVQSRPSRQDCREISALLSEVRSAVAAQDTGRLRKVSLFEQLPDEMVLSYFQFANSVTSTEIDIRKDGSAYWLRLHPEPVFRRLIRSQGQFLFQGDIITN